MFSKYSVIFLCGLLLGCGGGDGNGNMYDNDSGTEMADATLGRPDAAIDPNSVIPPPDAEGCHGLYAQDHLPTFELTVDPESWAGIYDEWVHGEEYEELEDQGTIEDATPYHPVAEFRYGDVVITNVAFRLRGNPTYWHDQNKLQFQISFNEYQKGGRFLGLKKILLDAAAYNRHFLRDRLSMAIMRDLGITAPCVNNAKLYINGEYYGLYTNIEKLDSKFLKRTYPEDPSGDLWKRTGWTLKTNEDTSDSTRMDSLRDASTVAEMEALLDVEQAIMIWAVDAVIPNSDGFWAGGFNFYLYDDPIRGKFVVLPWDLDNTFTRLESNVDPVTWRKTVRFHGRPWYDLMIEDPAWFQVYIDTIDRVLRDGYVVSRISDRIDQWSEQIEEAAFADYNKGWSNQVYLEQREVLRQYVTDRAAFVSEWLSCWQNGGTNDGSGTCIPPQ